jgi:hypothetical protein
MMLGRAGLFLVLFSLTTTAYAANGPGPFTTFYDFLSALEEMPLEEFVKMADDTPLVQIREYHQTLTALDPSNFERWNQKLKLIHAPGFSSGANYWELHAKGPELTIGFQPEKKPSGFESIADFYASVKGDEPGVFQTRVSLSSPDDLNRWLEIMSVRTPELFETAVLKVSVIREIGFHQKPKYRIPSEPKEPANPIGYVQSQSPGADFPQLKTVEDLIGVYEVSTPEEFLGALQTLSQQKSGRLLGAIKKYDPKLYLAMLEKAQSRTKIGYSSSSEPEVIPPGNAQQGEREPIGFKQGPKSCAEFLKPAR